MVPTKADLRCRKSTQQHGNHLQLWLLGLRRWPICKAVTSQRSRKVFPSNRICALSHLTPQHQKPSGSALLPSQIPHSNQYLAQLLPLVLSHKTKRRPKFYLCNRAASQGCWLALRPVPRHMRHCKASLQTSPSDVARNGTTAVHRSSPTHSSVAMFRAGPKDHVTHLGLSPPEKQLSIYSYQFGKDAYHPVQKHNYWQNSTSPHHPLIILL